MTREMAIGQTGNTLEYLEDLGIPDPKTDFALGAELRTMHDGTKKWVGPMRATWSWGYLTQTQRETLRARLTETSTPMGMRTKRRESSDAIGYYYGLAHWPEEPREPASVNHRLNFVIEWTCLVPMTPPNILMGVAQISASAKSITVTGS